MLHSYVLICMGIYIYIYIYTRRSVGGKTPHLARISASPRGASPRGAPPGGPKTLRFDYFRRVKLQF